MGDPEQFYNDQSVCEWFVFYNTNRYRPHMGHQSLGTSMYFVEAARRTLLRAFNDACVRFADELKSDTVSSLICVKTQYLEI